MPTTDGIMDVEISDRREAAAANQLDDRLRKLHIRPHSESNTLPSRRQAPYSPPIAGIKSKYPKARNTHSIDGARGPQSPRRGFDSWQIGGSGVAVRDRSTVIRMDPMGAVDDSLGRASRQSKKSKV